MAETFDIEYSNYQTRLTREDKDRVYDFTCSCGCGVGFDSNRFNPYGIMIGGKGGEVFLKECVKANNHLPFYLEYMNTQEIESYLQTPFIEV